MQKKERFKKIIAWFRENKPAPETELVYHTPFQLLVAVILSAQCTDKRINMVTPDLFEAFPDPESLSKATFDEVFPYIKSISYPNNKTKHLIGMARMLIKDFGGNVPGDEKTLQKLPGVGRKTANVVASVLYNRPTIPVDTHVFRLSRRIGLVSEQAKTPLQVEEQLMKYVPVPFRGHFHHWIILHGRYVCKARNPLCDECGIRKWCRYYAKKIKSDS